MCTLSDMTWGGVVGVDWIKSDSVAKCKCDDDSPAGILTGCISIYGVDTNGLQLIGLVQR